MSVTTLYQIEDELNALLETGEAGVSPEQEAAFVEALHHALVAAQEKRDRVAHFLAHCEQQVDFISLEIDRLKALRASYESARERMEQYVVCVIRSLGVDDKGRYRRLEGRTTCLSVRALPPSVEITNADAVPPQFVSISITLPEAALNRALRALPAEAKEELLGSVERQEKHVRKRAIKEALDRGEDVPGAVLAERAYGLVRR